MAECSVSRVLIPLGRFRIASKEYSVPKTYRKETTVVKDEDTKNYFPLNYNGFFRLVLLNEI
jgi:hypothetical protein